MYQTRGQALTKQIQDTAEQLEQTHVELKTFENLRLHEVGAIPRRIQVCFVISLVVVVSVPYAVFGAVLVCV
jgi:hypothetical protein